MSDFQCLPSRIFRCPSAISTADGGLTPLTDLASPGVRSPVCWFPTSTEEERKGIDESRIVSFVKTNMFGLRISSSYRVDEYVIDGTIDLAACVYDRLSSIFATTKIVMLRGEELHTTSVIVICYQQWLSIMYPVVIDGARLRFVRSHASGCSCRACGRLLSYLVTKPNRVGKYEYLSSTEVLSSQQETPIALPGFKAIFSSWKPTQLCLYTDLVVKWFPPSNCSFLETIQIALNTGSRADLDSLCVNTWLFTKYNGKTYRFKRLVFDMTPLSSSFFNKVTGELETYASYVARRYGAQIRCPASPLVEVYPEKASETCLLIPELCVLIRSGSRPPVPMQTVHAQTRLSPRERLVSIEALGRSLEIRRGFECVVEANAIEVEGEKFEISHAPGANVAHSISWVLLLVDCPYMSLPADLFGSPTSITACSEDEAESALRTLVLSDPNPELALIVLGNKSHLYSQLKCIACIELGVPCQIVRSNNLSKRPDILPELAEQIRLKTGGRMNEYSGAVAIGLDYHRFGLVCVFTACLMMDGLFTTRYRIEPSDERMPEIYVDLLREITKEYTLVSPPIIFVASRRAAFDSVSLRNRTESIMGRFSLVIVRVKTHLRLFSACGSNAPPGFIVDTPLGFYMVAHEVKSGNALPVLYEISEIGPMTKVEIEQITLNLCMNNKRLPILFSHTLKLSELIGIHFKRVLGKSLVRRLSSSQKWRQMFNRSFYL